ncbi:MAG: hypothetical protein H8E27_00845 [Verrucomicrobia subdivision 3 bacterium]|nr:hypothetical protein [Limisphaerales bacterium]
MIKRAQGNKDLTDAIDEIIKGRVKTTIKVVRNANDVLIGQYDTSSIDIGDIEKFPEEPGPGFSEAEALLHEVYEFWFKKKHNLPNTIVDNSAGYNLAHGLAIKKDELFDGWRRGMYERVDGGLNVIEVVEWLKGDQQAIETIRHQNLNIVEVKVKVSDPK